MRVQLAGDAKILSLAEVEVFGRTPYVGQSTNVALGKTANQSSTAWSGEASRAVDGNTSGDYVANSVTHTTDTPGTTDPYWEVDLGTDVSVSQIVLWNRTDCCADRLNNFYVFVSRKPFSSTDPSATAQQAGVWSWFQAAQAATETDVPASLMGRYVRVQLSGANRILALAEVQVLSP